MSRPRPQEIAELVCSSGESVAIITVESSINLRWANGQLTTNGRSDGVTTTAIAITGFGSARSTGSASGSVLTSEDARALASAARDAALAAGPADDAGDLVAGGVDADWDAPAGEVEARDFRDVPAQLADAFGSGMLLYGYAEFNRTTVYLATSSGMRRRSEVTAARFEVTAKSPDLTRSTWVGQGGRTFDSVDVPAAIASAAQQLEWQLRRVDLTPGRYDALLSPSAASDLFVDLLWSASAREAVEGTNAFAKSGGGTRVGERIGVPGISLSSDPTDLLLSTTPFVVAAGGSPVSSVFDNGLPLGATNWIEDGVLTALLSTRHSAALAGLPTTPFIDNARLTHQAGQGTLADVIARTGSGVLLNCLWYIRTVDPQRLLLTGLTRDGAYQVRDGEVVGAISNFRFNESPLDLLARIKDAGDTVRTLPRELGDYFPRVAMPPLLVADFNLSTLSQAS